MSGMPTMNGKVCDEVSSAGARKCPEYVEVKGTVPTFAGVYRQSDVLENGAPVYDGPGNTALSWSGGHWWLTITTVSEVGESNGHGYLATSMECPGDRESVLVRGGSDVIIAGASITGIDEGNIVKTWFVYSFNYLNYFRAVC